MKRFTILIAAAVMLLAIMLQPVRLWGQVVSGTTYSTPSTSGLPTGWSGSDGSGTNYIKLIASSHYIQTSNFTQNGFTSITIKARQFGGPSTAQAKITVSWYYNNTETVLGTIDPSNTTLTNYTISSPTNPTGNTEGYIKIQCKGASSSKGSGVSEVTINYTSSGGGSGSTVTYDFTNIENFLTTYPGETHPTAGTIINSFYYTNGDAFAASGSTQCSFNSGNYFFLGKSGAYLQLPAFSFDVEKIEVVGKSGASGSVVQNIYVGDQAVSTSTTGANGVTNSYTIADGYQTAGTVYKLKVTSNHNTQITQIKVYEKESSDPEISVTTTSLSGFTYSHGNGPSAAQSFAVSGSNLTANITVTAPTNYQVCLTENGTYANSVTLTQPREVLVAPMFMCDFKQVWQLMLLIQAMFQLLQQGLRAKLLVFQVRLQVTPSHTTATAEQAVVLQLQ